MEKAEFDLEKSWSILGKNAAVLISKLRSIVDPDQRVEAAEKALANAKTIARQLQANYHPDKNPNNVDRFIEVGKAIKSIEIYTKEMRDKRESFKNQIGSKERIFFK